MTDTRARQAAAGPDVLWRLRRLGELNGGWPLPLEAAAAIEARDAEIARLRDTLEAQKQAALDMMEAKDKALLSLASAILDREPHDWGLVPMRLRLAAMAALAPPPASDATPPPGWPTLENVR